MFFKKDGRCISSMSLVNLVFSSNHTSVCTIFKRVITTLLHIQFFFSICLGLLRSLTSAVYLRILRQRKKSFSELLALIDDTLFNETA